MSVSRTRGLTRDLSANSVWTVCAGRFVLGIFCTPLMPIACVGTSCYVFVCLSVSVLFVASQGLADD